MTTVDFSKINVLIAEDEEDLREIVSMIFEAEGCTVFTAKNGKEGVEMIDKHPIHLVISDVRMPGADGIYLLTEIRKRNPEIPVVFLATGYADLSEEDAQKRGAYGLINKPFSADHLLTLVREALSKLSA